jgi:hypothetical protein
LTLNLRISQILVPLNAVFFTTFWVMVTGNKLIAAPIFLISIFLHMINNSNLLNYISLILGISITTLMMQFGRISDFYFGKSVNLLIFTLLGFTFFSALILRFKMDLKAKDNVSQLYLNLFVTSITSIVMIFLEPINNSFAFKFLVPTGEDNASWLHGLSAGMGPDSIRVFTNEANEGGRTLTGILSTGFRELIAFGNNSYQLSDNTETLLRLYMACMLLVSSLIIQGVFVYAQQFKIKATFNLAISFLSGLTAYLGISSFAMFGHLTPIESLLCLFTAIVLISQIDVSSKSEHKNFTLTEIIFLSVLAFASTQAWYPILPGALFFVTLLLLKSVENFRVKFKFLIYSVSVMLFLIFFFNNSYQSLLAKLLADVHMPGGTIGPSALSLITVFMFGIFFIGKVNLTKSERKLSYVLVSLWQSLCAYYLFIICTSITTRPYTIDYAGQKLGLFLTVFFIPLIVTSVGIWAIRKNLGLQGIATVFILQVLILINIGTPTGSESSSNRQFGFPFVVFSQIKEGSQTFPEWSDPLISEIESNPGKQVLCLDTRVGIYNLEYAYGCSRFASGLTGTSNLPGVRDWWLMNRNSILTKDLQKALPSYFFQDTIVLRFDESRWTSDDITQQELTSVIPEGYIESVTIK